MENKINSMRKSKVKISSLVTTFLLKEKLNDNMSNTIDVRGINKDLGAISFLYLYTNSPPMGYGTPVPKVAETMNRKSEFNKKSDKAPLTVFGIGTEKLHWTSETEPFPFNTISSN